MSNATLTSFKAYDVVGLVASSRPCSLVNVDGYYGGAGNEFFQLHDSASIPATGAIPLRSYFMTGASVLPSVFASLGPIRLNNGLYVCFSSTAGTFTASASTGHFFGEVTEIEPEPAYTVAGDLTTARASLQVWATANGPKFLYKVTATNATGGAVQHLLLFASDSSSNGDIALRSWPLADGATMNLSFGSAGFSPVLSSNKGCTLRVSSTPGVLTAVAGTPWKIQARYV